jgi:hypothetical protein
MKFTYKITMSVIQEGLIDHLPITLKTNYRSAKRAFNRASQLHKQNRSICITEHCELGTIASWEMPYDYDGVIFDCDEELCRILDERGIEL